MSMVASCPLCDRRVPFRRDRRGGRFLRCNDCQLAFFFSGKSVIDRLEAGGTWSFTITTDTTADNAKPNTTDSAPSKKPDDLFDLFPWLFEK
jgi:hypothetical protein